MLICILSSNSKIICSIIIIIILLIETRITAAIMVNLTGVVKIKKIKGLIIVPGLAHVATETNAIIEEEERALLLTIIVIQSHQLLVMVIHFYIYI